MPTSSPRRTTPRRAVETAPPTPAPVTEEREPRGARRKRETRARLLEAALRLMAEKGMEGVAINEITETADVGFGSFYNHFESKEAIYTALTDWVFEGFADTLDRLVGDVSDPAEVISVSVRHTLLRARREPVWGQFLIREGFSSRALSRGLGQRLLRDIGKGVATKRFIVSDPLMSLVSVGGTVLGAIAAELQFASPAESAAVPFKELGFSTDNLPERAAAMVLQALGVERAEADEIAHRPLPVLESQVRAG
ncbi:TetR family transcriptional regulator [Burkholderia pseudomallei]|uniref:TetR/AcrR family transcriptional regulator n=1 Tax=Burkholderia pseudomallei TaxID=28450 RepID=UPI000A1A1ACE|nr:TetR/AcrR family transcriptional regulator [Burkholderia pseudomallei]ARL05078.1 TetR family transcriptional regulator [Burkholderia pseudomallei]OSP90871.1 TetR family transcriptional regulator [Burkholderia pseudomallei]